MSCKKYGEWFHLFWDKRLNQSQEEEFKKHLAECRECQQDLSFLELVEGKAKGIHAKEPMPEYWEAFSGRVRERLVIQKETAPAFGLKKFLESIFVISPWKIKVAAGVASIVLVFIIGKLYMDYRGKEIIPSSSITGGVKEQPLKITEIEKQKTPPLGENQGKIISSVDKTKRMPESVVSDQGGEKSVSQKIKRSEKPALLKDQEISVPAQTAGGKSTPPSPAPQAKEITPNIAKQKVPVETPPATGAGGEKKIERLKVEAASSQAEKTKQGTNIQEILAPEKGIIIKDITTATKTSLISAPSADQYVIDQKAIPKIDETDTLMQADELKNVIQTWIDHFRDNPADSINNQGYLQVATAYFLLSRLSPDSTIISEGSQLIDKYRTEVKDQTVKDQLSHRLEKIKALGKR